MKAMTDLGIDCSLRFRPAMPGISDRTPNYKYAWRDLLRASADAGCRAVSFEIAFVPGVMPDHIKKMWREVEKIAGIPMVDWYKKTTSAYGACLRSSRAWKQDFTFAVYEETKRLGMTFAISDPHWKELNEYGCCCGIPPDHPYFGGWQRKQATNAIVVARDEGKRVSAADGIPGWAMRVPIKEMVCIVGPKGSYAERYIKWGDKLRDTWNDLKAPRGPVGYFEGCLIPVGRKKNGDVIYKYKEVPREELPPAPYWKID
jgi:hypothetical protein